MFDFQITRQFIGNGDYHSFDFSSELNGAFERLNICKTFQFEITEVLISCYWLCGDKKTIGKGWTCLIGDQTFPYAFSCLVLNA